MKFIVENWDTEEVIKTFGTEEARAAWIAENVRLLRDRYYNDVGGYLADGTRISVYEED